MKKFLQATVSLALVLLMLAVLMPARAQAAVETRSLPVAVRWEGATAAQLPAVALNLTLKQTGPLGTDANYASATLSTSTSMAWTGSFSPIVPKTTVDGTRYAYEVVWPTVPDFTLVSSAVSYESGATATYQYGTTVPATYDVAVVWEGEPNNNIYRPSGFEVQLLNAASTNPTAATITPANSWRYTFTGITGKTDGSKPITVSVPAAPTGYTPSYSMSGNTFIITMTYNISLRNISGTIEWPSVLPVGTTIPSSVAIALVRGDHTGLNVTVATMTVPTSGAGANSFVFSGYPITDPTGQPYYYGVVEFGADGFTPSYSGSNTYCVVTNHLNTYPEIHLRVNVRWSDSGNKRARRPVETTVYLYRDGVYTGYEMQVRYADQWTNVFAGLPRSDGYGHYYKYSVRAAKVPYYYARPAYANYNTSVTLTYVYGTGSYTDSPKTDTTVSTKAPAVGDPLLYRADSLSYQEIAQMMLEDRAAMAHYDELATTAKASTSAKDIDFDKLKKTNSDIAAWLVCDGTTIDYPVVKGANNTYYMNHLFDKSVNRSGALFIDMKCDRKVSDRNTVIYGHHMADGEMFANLLNYKKQAYYDAHPTMKLYTPTGNYTIELFAGFTAGDERSAVAKLSFSGNSDFMSYANACIKKSDFATGVDVDASDKIVTFVTCAADYDNTRYLVMGRLVKD